MRRTARLAMVVGWCGLIAAGLPAQPQKAGREGVVEIFSGVAKPDEPGLAVLVKKEGRVMFERGYGAIYCNGDHAARSRWEASV